jgi:HK97 family phage portal protein
VGFWDILKRPVTPVMFEPQVAYIGGADDHRERLAETVRFALARVGIEYGDVGRMTVPELWRTQPHLRTVVSFLARNIAQTTLNAFVRVDDEQRLRDNTSRLAKLLRNPGDGRTPYDLIFALVGDLMLYDRAFWVVGVDDTGTDRIRRLPPAWVSPIRVNPFEVSGYLYAYGNDVAEIPAANVIEFSGYAPTGAMDGSPTIDTLRATLQEQIEATAYRLQTWKKGGRASAVLQRPADAPQWSDPAREAFREDWYAKYTGRGSYAGGTPILEDGMTLNRIDFSAKDQEFVEAAKLSLGTVASAFHVNPTMIGLLDNANYSNVREFRRMLYGDTLGPIFSQIEARINIDLVQMLDEQDDAERFVEFNIADKVQGTFEEQVAALQSAVGRPWMTADEARSRIHMKPLGGDAGKLVTPLNVLVGGQASPTDSGTQNQGPKGVTPALKSATPMQREQISRVIDGFLKRQGATVLSAVAADAKDWWDGDRWDRELADDLTKVSHTIAGILGKAQADSLGYPDGYDPDRTVKFLQTVMARKAGNINSTTKKQVEDAMDAGDPATVFASDTRATRSSALAIGLGTFTASFAAGEAARQVAYVHGGSPTKTWVTGPNPRPSHAEVDGETVPIDQPFSNGCMWPADGPDVDEVAGCNCSVDIGF